MTPLREGKISQSVFWMNFRQLFIAITLIVALPMTALFAATETNDTSTETTQAVGSEKQTDGHGESGHHGLPPNAVVLKKIGPFAITNSMVVTWIVAFGLIAIAQIATKKAKLIPSGLQNFVEWLVESLIDFFGGILGEKMAKETFWFFGTAFIFILFSNWFGLVPGVGTVGWAHGNPGFFHSEHLSAPLLRGVNADLNMTASMAIFFFGLWFYWSIKAIGPGGFFFHIFNVKGHKLTFMGVFIFFIYIFVGIVEVVSISVRPIALMSVSYTHLTLPTKRIV